MIERVKISRLGRIFLVPFALLTLLAGPPPEAQVRKIDPLTDSGLIERTGVSLILLDVEVLDEEGRPVPGLTKDDFTVRLNMKQRPIYSLDDLCPAVDEGAAPIAAGEVEQKVAGESAVEMPRVAAPPVSAVERVRYVLYFDFSRLAMDGRELATTEARRWIRETMQTGEEAMVAAYSTLSGLERLTSFTDDKSILLGAIDEAYGAVEFRDTYGTELEARAEACCMRCSGLCIAQGCCRRCVSTGSVTCRMWGFEEYNRSKDTLQALQRLLSSLAQRPGRKAVLFFHQNATAQPQYMLGLDTMDHLTLLEEIGADATLARATISSAFSGNERMWQPWLRGLAVNLGANLADYTGGRYNRRLNDLASMTDATGRGSSCIYRIGIEPPDPSKSRVYRVTVGLGDRLLPYRYRVQHLTEADKWWRATLDVLEDPGDANDVPIAAAVLPVRAVDGRWEVKIQVALDVGSLELLQRGKKQAGEWEIGALLIRGQGYGKKWEMLGNSKLVRRGEGDSTVSVLHERTLSSLQPGEYEVRAFARDKWSDLYGGGAGMLVLPKPDKLTMAGPVVMLPDGRHVVSTLPDRREGAGESTESSDVRTGSLPLGDRAAIAGETLEFLTWICPGARRESIFDASRYVSAEDEPLFRLEEPEFGRAGDCVSVTDRLDTSPMAPGEYVYHVVWDPGDEAEPVRVQRAFRVEDKPVESAAAEASGLLEQGVGEDHAPRE